MVMFSSPVYDFTVTAFNSRVKTVSFFAMLIVCNVNSQGLVVHQGNFNCQSVVLVFNISLNLSNDPDKKCGIFYCSVAIHFLHDEKVVFSEGEFINRWKAGL